jgi:hypothetical protein
MEFLPRWHGVVARAGEGWWIGGGDGDSGYRSGLSHPVGQDGAMAGEFDDIRQRLESISEELSDLAIQRLRESIDAGGHELPIDERRLNRARRAVEKAASILREPDDTDYDV